MKPGMAQWCYSPWPNLSLSWKQSHEESEDDPRQRAQKGIRRRNDSYQNSSGALVLRTVRSPEETSSPPSPRPPDCTTNRTTDRTAGPKQPQDRHHDPGSSRLHSPRHLARPRGTAPHARPLISTQKMEGHPEQRLTRLYASTAVEGPRWCTPNRCSRHLSSTETPHRLSSNHHDSTAYR